MTFNHGVEGSSPSALTNVFNRLVDIDFRRVSFRMRLGRDFFCFQAPSFSIFDLGASMSMVTSLVHSVAALLPSDALKTVLTGGAGALFGAWLTSRSRTKHKIVDELVALRAAHSLCVSTSNQLFALKRQHTLPMKQRYDEAVRTYANRGRTSGQVVHVGLDMQTLTPIWLPTERLESIIFEKCPLGAKGLATVVSLVGAGESLNLAIKYRNDLIDEFRARGPTAELDRIRMYVADRGSDGVIDTRFQTSVTSLLEQTNDGIFFSRALENELVRYHTKLRRRHWTYLLPGGKLEKASWKIAEDAGLMPPDSAYEMWTRGFVSKPSKVSLVLDWIKTLPKRVANLMRSRLPP